jgi:hypothetical protein
MDIVLPKELVSTLEIIMNYSTCRQKAEKFGKLFVAKKSQPDGVLFSIAEYERLSAFINYLESLEQSKTC